MSVRRWSILCAAAPARAGGRRCRAAARARRRQPCRRSRSAAGGRRHQAHSGQRRLLRLQRRDVRRREDGDRGRSTRRRVRRRGLHLRAHRHRLEPAGAARGQRREQRRRQRSVRGRTRRRTGCLPLRDDRRDLGGRHHRDGGSLGGRRKRRSGVGVRALGLVVDAAGPEDHRWRRKRQRTLRAQHRPVRRRRHRNRRRVPKPASRGCCSARPARGASNSRR